MSGASAVAAAATVLLVASCRSASRSWRRRRGLGRLGAGGGTVRRGPTTLPVPDRLARALTAAAVPHAADLVWTVWVLVALAAPVAALVAAGPALAVVVLLSTAATPLLLLAATSDRSAREVDGELPRLLDGVARGLRSGATLRQALEESVGGVGGRLARDVGVTIEQARGGVSLVAALDGWLARCPSPSVRLTVAALALATDAGGAAARAVDGVAATLRANLAVTAEVRAQASQARLSALVIALAPIAFGVLAAGLDGHTGEFLLHSPLGALCLTAGLGLDAAGAWWMHRITAVEP